MTHGKKRMNPWRLFVLMGLLVLLVACGGGGRGVSDGETLALEIRTELLGMTACTANVKVTADYGQRVFAFTLAVQYDKELGGVLTVVEPEIAKGVTARITPQSTYLEYDGASLETGPLTDGGLSPIEAMPLFLKIARTGNMATTDLDDGVLTVGYRQADTTPGTGLEVTLAFAQEGHAPLWGEIYNDNVRVLDCQFSDVTMMVAQPNAQ